MRSLLYVCSYSHQDQGFFYIVSRLLFSIIGTFEILEIDSSHCKLRVKLESLYFCSFMCPVIYFMGKVSGTVMKVIAAFYREKIFVVTFCYVYNFIENLSTLKTT